MYTSTETLKPGHGQLIDYALHGIYAENRMDILRREIDDPVLGEVHDIMMSEPRMHEATMRPKDFKDDEAHQQALKRVRMVSSLLITMDDRFALNSDPVSEIIDYVEGLARIPAAATLSLAQVIVEETPEFARVLEPAFVAAQPL